MWNSLLELPRVTLLLEHLCSHCIKKAFLPTPSSLFCPLSLQSLFTLLFTPASSALLFCNLCFLPCPPLWSLSSLLVALHLFMPLPFTLKGVPSLDGNSAVFVCTLSVSLSFFHLKILCFPYPEESSGNQAFVSDKEASGEKGVCFVLSFYCLAIHVYKVYIK